MYFAVRSFRKEPSLTSNAMNHCRTITIIIAVYIYYFYPSRYERFFYPSSYTSTLWPSPCSFCWGQIHHLVSVVGHKKSMQCPDCGITIQRKKDIGSHFKQMHGQCSQCTYSTSNKPNMKRHLQAKHVKGVNINISIGNSTQDSYQCPSCPKQFSSVYYLNQHIDKHISIT